MTVDQAADGRTLADRYSFGALEKELLPRDSWQPFPTVADRADWEAVRAPRRAAVIAQAEAVRGRPWPVLPATLYAEYARTGVRVNFEREHRSRRAALSAHVLAECLTGDGAFLGDAVDLAWMICEETSWCYPATSHPPRLAATPWDGRLPDHRAPVVDLFAAETGSLLGWTHYLLEPLLRKDFPQVLDRIADEVRRRLLVPYRTVDEWRWLRPRSDGRPPSNWNPWIHSNLIAATLAVEADAYTRVALVARMARGLDAFLAGYGDDGGCEEGVSYFWQAGARLFECLDLLSSATGGAVDAFDHPKVAEIARYFHRMHIGGDWYVNFGDGSARQDRGGDLLYRFGSRLRDPQIQAHALAMRPRDTDAVEVDGRDPMHRLLPTLLSTAYADAAPAPPPLVRDAWLPSIEVLTCRQRAGTTDGLVLAAKGGHNGENHNHNDVGSFVVSLDGDPLLIDVGVGVYTRDTFGANRYDIWTMRSAYHNVPLVDGGEQPPGRDHRARDVSCEITDESTTFGLDLADAYPGCGVRRWRRTLRLDRGGAGQLTLTDDYQLSAAPTRLAVHLMCRPEPRLGDGQVVLPGQGRALVLRIDTPGIDVRAERIAVDDTRLAQSWGPAVHRIVLEVRQPTATGVLVVAMTPQPIQTAPTKTAPTPPIPYRGGDWL